MAGGYAGISVYLADGSEGVHLFVDSCPDGCAEFALADFTGDDEAKTQALLDALLSAGYPELSVEITSGHITHIEAVYGPR